MISNYSELVNINKSSSVINCIDGIKVLSAIWICVGHRKPKNLLSSKLFIDKTILNAIGRFDIAVTTFFVCSAVVVTQSLLKALDRWEFWVLNNFLRIFRQLNFYLFQEINWIWLKFFPTDLWDFLQRWRSFCCTTWVHFQTMDARCHFWLNLVKSWSGKRFSSFKTLVVNLSWVQKNNRLKT